MIRQKRYLFGGNFPLIQNRLKGLMQNTGFVNTRLLAVMKPSAFLINVARGELFDEKVLIRALREKWFAGAGLDVFETEPLPLSSPLLELDNVILTPHWLPSTHRAARATWDLITRNVFRVARGMAPQNVVNPEVLVHPGFRAKLARFASNAQAGLPGAKGRVS